MIPVTARAAPTARRLSMRYCCQDFWVRTGSCGICSISRIGTPFPTPGDPHGSYKCLGVAHPVYLDVDCRLTIRKCDMFATRMRHFPVPAWCTNTLDTQRYEIGECCQRSEIEANW